MIRKFCLAAACLVAGLSSSYAQTRNKTIYGQDDRQDLYQVTDPGPLRLADATVALFDWNDVLFDPSGATARLRTQGYGAHEHLCPGEPFYNQPIPVGATCSGSLVGPDLVMTAAHCISSDTCAGEKFVFGFSFTRENADPTVVPAGEVYGCKGIVGSHFDPQGADWALVRLGRPVSNHTPLAIDRGQGAFNGENVLVIGHPAGLPTKIAGTSGAVVRDASPNGYFVTNLDAFGGNSGSPVFDARSGLVEGILVRGDGDYDFGPDGSCMVARRCPANACDGEAVTKISQLSAYLP